VSVAALARQVMLTCILHGQQGAYDPAAVSAWQTLATKYGESVQL
jgi:hypothetical protein